MKVSITDVAKEAGVSIATASKALNGTGAIGADTIKRVLETAERMGYRPNRAAQLLASKNKTIGIVIPVEPSEVYSLFEKGIREAMEEYTTYGVRFHIRRFRRNTEEFQKALADMQDVNGLIFTPAVDGFKEEMLSSFSMPKVALQTAVDMALCPCVTVDADMTGRMAADILTLFSQNTQGKTAIIAGSRSMDIHRKNIHGFLSVIAERRMQNIDIRDCFDRYADAYRYTEEIIRNHPDVSGIFVSSYIAPAVCACLKDLGRAGCRHAKDIGNGGLIQVVGVDVTPESAECLRDGSLTALIYQNQILQARKAVDLLMSLLREEIADSILTKPELVFSSNLSYYL